MRLDSWASSATPTSAVVNDLVAMVTANTAVAMDVAKALGELNTEVHVSVSAKTSVWRAYIMID